MAGRFVYVACADAREIFVYRMDGACGALTPVETVAIPGLTDASPTSPLAISGDRRFLYAALRLEPFPVASFAIDPVAGTLRLLGTARLPASMAYVSTDRTARWLLSASYGGAVVAASPIDSDGVIRKAAAQILATPPKAHCILPSPDNRYVYAACLGGDAVLCWSFDPAQGLVSPDAPRATPIRPGAGPRHLAFGRGGRVLYVVNELDGTVDVFARDTATGALTHRQTAATLAADPQGKAAAADIHLTPDERFLYASVRRDSVIAAFRIDPADGTLAAIGRFEVETTPRSFAIGPDGRFLISAGRDAASIGVYAIDPATGHLSRQFRYATSPNPNWVEVLDLS
jgi:6-phosphogluconolactonase